MRRLWLVVSFVVLAGGVPAAADRSFPRDPDQPPRIAAKAGSVRQATSFHTSTWRYPQGDELCTIQRIEGVPSDRAKRIEPGRKFTRVLLFTSRRPERVDLVTYSRRTASGEYAGASRPSFRLQRFRDQRGREGWRIVFTRRVRSGDLLRGDVRVRWPDNDGCGPDRGLAAFTFRAR